MSDRKHPVWFLLFVALILAAGLGYCELSYANGLDLPRDSVLIGFITAATALWMKFIESKTE
jgi:hypothetical protein